jgi:hypothetical protein
VIWTGYFWLLDLHLERRFLTVYLANEQISAWYSLNGCIVPVLSLENGQVTIRSWNAAVYGVEVQGTIQSESDYLHSFYKRSLPRQVINSFSVDALLSFMRVSEFSSSCATAIFLFSEIF